MPSPEQIAWAKFRVSTMIGCAVGIASVLVYLLLGGAAIFEPSAPVYAYMVDLSGLIKGSPVRFNGIRVGEVTSAGLSHLKDPQKAVRVDMSIMSRYLSAIPQDSTVHVAADNVIGDKFANIEEGKSPRQLRAGAELMSPPEKGINQEDLLRAGREILANFDSMMSDIEAGRGALGQFFQGEEFYDLMLKKIADFQRAARSATAKDTAAGRIIYDQTFYEGLRAPVKSLDEVLTNLQAGQGPGGKFLKDPAQYEALRKSVESLKRALDDMASGKGAGALLKDDSQYRQLVGMLARVNAQLAAFQSGEGQLGRLYVRTQLYDALNGSTQSLQQTLKELRQNPQKFLRLKVF